MTVIHLLLPTDDDGHADVTVAADFSDSDLMLLRRYLELIERVRSTALLERGMGGFKGFSWDRGKITITAAECSDRELHELLHVMRLVTLENEPSNFQRACAILARRIHDQPVREFLKDCGRAFRHGEMSMYMQFTLAGQPMFHESLLNMWLNATQYHSDTDKAEAWQALEASLTAPNARAVVVSQLHSKVLALLNAAAIAQRVILAHEA